MIKGLVLGVVVIAVLGLLAMGGYWMLGHKDITVTGKTIADLAKGLDGSDTPANGQISKGPRSTSDTKKTTGAVTGSKSSQESLSIEQTRFAYDTLILHILDLRDIVGKDILKQVELVNIINQDIRQIGSDNIQEQWETTALCLAKTCLDKDFMQLILTVAIEGDRDGYVVGNLIMNILTANKYWGSDNTIRFSEALDKANKQITSLNKPAISEGWKKFVACDGKCSEKNSLTFSVIRQTVSS
ncbi:MAG: hypothetical protein AABX70_06935 [Nanoarchaeota archaeon]